MSEYRLGDLQLRIMQVLWDEGARDGSGCTMSGCTMSGCTVSAVHQALKRQTPRDRQLAYTTVATMLRKMEDRGLVTHDAEGRKFVYRAAVAADEVTRSMAGDLLDRLFEGSLADMVHHMLTEREVSQEELSRLEQLIAERKRQRRGGHHAR
jgi:predicted transcriptional regulator